ncbi:hypothetical protein [Limosilactobacillus reuteri]|uniref:hypothetical protein n=1 Tax=Limosilactobacillus reuteri TaxID=1598 RepID=UPI0010943454|nr:hypothetical protein [Limosilactobacillus reuteri]TGY61011.1 hypothetical protein E5337_06250 [Limosilactobacillus reuteri]
MSSELVMPLSPQEFKDWYRKADLELIVGARNQEISSNTDLWRGFEVYIHQYSLKPDGKLYDYWDIERNRFNPKNKLFKVRKKLFRTRNRYGWIENYKLSELLKEERESSIELRIQHRVIDLMREKLSGLVRYMDSAFYIRENIIKALYKDSSEAVYIRHNLENAAEEKLTLFQVLQVRKDKLNHLLSIIDNPGIEQIPTSIAIGIVAERYREIMSGRRIEK